MNEIILNVEGMHCSGCENRIKNVVSQIPGVSEVTADHTNGKVTVKGEKEIDMAEIKNKIEDLDFKVIE